jgi:replication initiation and membrane attachment protein
MTGTMGELSPNDSFIINSQRSMTDFERRALTALYRPLLTSDAYSLIAALWEMSEQVVTEHPQNSHTILLNWLGIDLPSILDARGRLEALGLLKTYRKQVDNRTLFLYNLQAPADPVKFFKDDTLSTLLLGMVGEDEFQRLSNSMIHRTLDRSDFYDVSKQLGDYFQLSQSVVNPPQTIKKVQAELNTNVVEKNEVINADFDFKLLTQMLSTSFVDRKSLLENEHLIMVEQTIYGITESEMAQLIKSATNFENNQIDPAELKRKIVNAYHQGEKVRPDAGDQMPSSKAKVEASEVKGLSQAEKAVIEATQAMSPNDFIKNIKSQTGGFTTSAEERIISGLVNTGQMPVSVVNFLIYYFLVDQGRPTLNKNLMEAIANDWIKNKVRTPVDALKFIRTRKEQRQQAGQKYAKKKRIIERETLPEWAKDSATQPIETKATSSETTKSINEQLKKLRARGKEE